MNKNRKIAEFCGYKYHGQINDKLWMYDPVNGEICLCPDYCNDLNAIHEAEKCLNDDQKSNYLIDESYKNRFGAIHASIEERVKSFLKVTNLD